MIKLFGINEYIPIYQWRADVDAAKFHKSIDFLKDITIKLLTGLLLLNGGAIVASLTFIGTLINSPNSIYINKFNEPLLYFAIGSAVAVILCGITYFSQSYYSAAIDSSLSILSIQQYKVLNQRKIEFYLAQQAEAVNDMEKAHLSKIVDGLYRDDANYDEEINKLKSEQTCENCKGDTFRKIAIAVFLIDLGLFFYGVYHMSLILLIL